MIKLATLRFAKKACEFKQKCSSSEPSELGFSAPSFVPGTPWVEGSGVSNSDMNGAGTKLNRIAERTNDGIEVSFEPASSLVAGYQSVFPSWT